MHIKGKQRYFSDLGPKFLDFWRKLLALDRVLPLCSFLRLDNLEKVQIFLLELLLLQQQLVETGDMDFNYILIDNRRQEGGSETEF